jgi:hypothetical protein
MPCSRARPMSCPNGATGGSCKGAAWGSARASRTHRAGAESRRLKADPGAGGTTRLLSQRSWGRSMLRLSNTRGRSVSFPSTRSQGDDRCPL